MATSRRAAVAVSGIGLGSFVAAALSWQHNHSVLWMLIHAIYSWFYVAYQALVSGGVIPPVG